MKISQIDSQLAKELCRSIAATLPEWFGMPGANERYEQGMQDRLSFAASIEHDYVGMITLEFPYPNNANIYWMAVTRAQHGRQIGSKLLQAAENYCRERGCTSLTVETLSSKQQDENYLKTYHFYLKAGFKPLFEMYTHDPHHLMVYMQKTLSLDEFEFIDLTHALSAEIPHWGDGCGFRHTVELDYANCTGDAKFRVQSIQTVAGIGTHMDAPAHCIEGLTDISGIPLQHLIVPCIVIDVSDRANAQYCVTANDIIAFEDEYGVIPRGSFVIVYTGWDTFWHQADNYRNGLMFPSISKQAAELLLVRDVVGLGIDTLSPDTGTSDFPVHQLFLGAGKYLIENIANAKQMKAIGNFIMVLPMKIQQGTEAPIRLLGVTIKRATA